MQQQTPCSQPANPLPSYRQGKPPGRDAQGHHIRVGVEGHAGAARRYRTADNPPGKAAGIKPSTLM